MANVNKVYNESCLETIEKLDNESVDLVFTSPPYYNVKDYVAYDSVDAYMKSMEEIFSSIFLKIKKSRMCVINVSPIIIPRSKRSEQSRRIPIPFYFVPMMENIGYEFLEDIIWEKPDGAAKNRNAGFYVHRKPVAYKPNLVAENILVFKKPAPFLIDKVLRGYSGETLKRSLVEDGYERTNIWKINPETTSKHPAPFPLELAEKVIRYYSYLGDLIYDPFMGSGTTLLAAKKLGRKWIGSEIHQLYCEIAQERLK